MTSENSIQKIVSFSNGSTRGNGSVTPAYAPNPESAGERGYEKIKDIQQRLREKSERLLASFKRMIEENGGEIDLEGRSIIKQHFGWNSIYSPVRLTLRYVSYVDYVPNITIEGRNYDKVEAELFLDKLVKAIKIIENSEKDSGVTISEICFEAAEIEKLYQQLELEELRKKAEEFSQLLRQQILWERDNIKVVLEREGGELNIRKKKIEGWVKIVIYRDSEKIDFWIGDYITSTKKFRKDRFIKSMKYVFGDYTEEVANYVKIWNDMIEKERAKYRLR